MILVLVFTLKVPFTTSFRNPWGVNVHFTYPFPPWTTIHGLLKAARGLSVERPDHGDWEFGLVVEREGELLESYTKIRKGLEGDNKKAMGVYGATIVTKQLLYQPRYTAYMKCRYNDSGRLVEDTLEALANPCCGFLCLGDSDSIVITKNVHIVETELESVAHIDSVVPGEADGCEPYDMPTRFFFKDKNSNSPRDARRWCAKMRTFSMPPVGEGVNLNQPVRAYPVEGRNVMFA